MAQGGIVSTVTMSLLLDKISRLGRLIKVRVYLGLGFQELESMAANGGQSTQNGKSRTHILNCKQKTDREKVAGRAPRKWNEALIVKLFPLLCTSSNKDAPPNFHQCHQLTTKGSKARVFKRHF